MASKITLPEAYQILDADENISEELLKANYRWLVWFYHPDIKIGNDPIKLTEVIEAFKIISSARNVKIK